MKAAVLLTLISFGLFAHAEETPEPTPTPEALIEAALIQAAIRNMQANIEAAGRESGEIDKLIRALAGISIRDIEKYGICGGKNSEVRKLIGSLCNDID